MTRKLSPEEIIRRREEAKKKLKDWMIENIFTIPNQTISARETCNFFISIEKEINYFPFRAAVGYRENSIKLFMDVNAILEASEEELDFYLLHELGHIARLSFSRTKELSSFYGVKEKQIVPFSDPPINYAIKQHPGYTKLKNSEQGIFTYDTIKQQSKCKIKEGMTYEEIVEEVMKNPEENLPQIPMYFIDSEGNILDQDGQKVDDPANAPQGEAIASPHPSEIPGIKETIEKHTENVLKSIGSESSYFLKNILSEITEDTERGYVLFEKYLVGFRTSRQPAERSFSKLKRKALPLGLVMPETITKDDAFNCLFVVDESGSMSDTHIEYAAGMLQKILTRRNLDTIHIIQWDTQLHEPIEELKSTSSPFEYKRRGCGGTIFSNTFQHEEVKKRLKECDLVVFITDGWFNGLPEFEDIKPKPIIWLLTEQNSSGETEIRNRGDILIDISFI